MIIRIQLIWLILVFLCEAKVSLRHYQSNKNFINQLDEGSFEISHPFQVRDKKERIGIDTHNYFFNATVHYKNVVIVIPSKSIVGVRLKLILNLNDYLFLNETQFRKFNENGETNLDSHIENCYYQGVVNGDPSSFVAISTCHGLWGVIAFENGTTLGIWPLNGGDQGRRHPHVLYRSSWTRDSACGAVTHVPPEFLALRAGLDVGSSTKIKRDVSHQMKYLELAIVGDYNFIRELNATAKEGIEYMLNAVNIADIVITRNLKIHVSIVYAEVWMDAQRVDLHSDIQQTLSGALDYITGHIYHVEKDASIVFTGGFFANSETMSASFSSVCTARSVGIAKVIDSFAIHATSQLVSHVIGHIIGIDHDSAECVCRENTLCTMNRQIGSIGSSFTWEFSKCSVARLHNVLQSEHFQCLLSRPFQTSRLHSCGNGVVDNDEECDCGRRDECKDPCCDPITCTLRSHARCASHQACCHSCELRPIGHICRKSKSVCDVSETCDGVNGDCPADGYFIDGVSCGINGHCWKGNCSDSEQQCKNLWGSTAKLADEPCFDSNQKGLEYGNCGANKNGEYLICSAENQRCGTLHCKDGNASPQPATFMSFNLQFIHNNRQVQCKAIIGTESDVALVKDGTHCANGKICIENACVPLAQVSAPVHCPTNNLALQCSGHGDCTTTAKCLCYDGWSGNACDVRSNVSRRVIFSTILPAANSNDLFPGLKMARSLDTATLLGILLAVGIFLLLILICLLFCYRRRSSADLHLGNGIHEKVEDEAQENSSRAIKFGQMPSYRDEKRKKKKNKRVYDALQRINEAADERDTVSLKSRESSTAASAVNNVQVENDTNQIHYGCGGGGSSLHNMHNRHNSSSNLQLTHQQHSQKMLQQQQKRPYFFRSTDHINNLSIAKNLLPNHNSQKNFKIDASCCLDSLKKYKNGDLPQHSLYAGNFLPQSINQHNMFLDPTYQNSLQPNNRHLPNFHPSVVLSDSSANLSHLQNGGATCYSPSRSDFCVGNYGYTGNSESLLRRNTLQRQQQQQQHSCVKALQFNDRNGYATDSEVVTSGFCSGSGSGSASLRFTTGLSDLGCGFLSPLSSALNGNNQNSGGNDAPLLNGINHTGIVTGILSDSDCLDTSSTPPPPLRLQSIQMLMKQLNPNSEEDELQLFNKRHNLKVIESDCSQILPSDPNCIELNNMFIGRTQMLDDRTDREYELTSANIAAHHRHHQFNNGILNGVNSSLVGNIMPEPPPASADSGHPGSNYDVQESPLLFLDPFKLDLSN